MSTREKIYDVVLTLLIWISLWVILEWLIPGDVKETTITLYIGACLGYIMCTFTAKFKRKKKDK